MVHVFKQDEPHHNLITASISSSVPLAITVRVHDAVVPEKDKPGIIDNARGVVACAAMGIENSRTDATSKVNSRFLKIVTSLPITNYDEGDGM